MPTIGWPGPTGNSVRIVVQKEDTKDFHHRSAFDSPTHREHLEEECFFNALLYDNYDGGYLCNIDCLKNATGWWLLVERESLYTSCDTRRYGHLTMASRRKLPMGCTCICRSHRRRKLSNHKVASRTGCLLLLSKEGMNTLSFGFGMNIVQLMMNIDISYKFMWDHSPSYLAKEASHHPRHSPVLQTSTP